MNAFGFDGKTFQRDILAGAVKPFKLRMVFKEFAFFLPMFPVRRCWSWSRYRLMIAWAL